MLRMTGRFPARLEQCRQGGQAGIPPGELLGYFKEAAEALDYLDERFFAYQEDADLCRRALEAAPQPSAAANTAANMGSLSESSCSQPLLAAPIPHTGALGERSNEAQLLQLARALRDFLRRS